MSKCEQCIIRQFNALKSLSKADLIHISGCKTSKVIKKGTPLFEEGDHMNGVYCIRDGICKLTKLSSNGKDQIIKLVVKGDLLGQRSVIADQSANLGAVALTDMEVCFIPKKEILNDLQKNPKFSLDMLQQLAKDLKEADEVIVDMAQKTVKQRLAETLLYLHSNFELDSEGFLSVILSREDFSNLIGTATESAIRLLSQFKKEGYISTQGKRIKIESVEQLKLVV